jgi:hypothetical protein
MGEPDRYFFATARGNAISEISLLNWGSGVLLFGELHSFGEDRMSATKILWGQVTIGFAIVLIAVWGATQWSAWRLGFQPQLGRPWFELRPGILVYVPSTFFWWFPVAVVPGQQQEAAGPHTWPGADTPPARQASEGRRVR